MESASVPCPKKTLPIFIDTCMFQGVLYRVICLGLDVLDLTSFGIMSHLKLSECPASYMALWYGTIELLNIFLSIEPPIRFSQRKKKLNPKYSVNMPLYFSLLPMSLTTIESVQLYVQ